MKSKLILWLALVLSSGLIWLLNDFASGRNRAWKPKKGIGIPLLCQRKNDGRTGKRTCKSVEQAENQKRSMLVVGKKPNGKSQFKYYPLNS